MKYNITIAIRLSVICLFLFAVLYPFLIWALAQTQASKGKEKMIEVAGKSYYYHIGQAFNGDHYFQSRPSAVDYNAAGSGGSNKGPSNEAYLDEVAARIDTFLQKNPTVQRAQVPVDLVTASGSGLDPHISVQAAYVQVARIAELRGLSAPQVNNLIAQNKEEVLWGLFGPETIHVLKLNLALDNLKNKLGENHGK
ncbi:potassium-transporting ATPase subunit C [Sphingobacterium sp. UBA6645]|uniref:potassium-transporting ATPase subunit C n=1 Tax=Sphingobacterium sp. UBA6645 TaxID=1947511 RepID=UPI0025DF3227|nr:potassium-transporting ATPase subunit C [Sphingobacterium sp. UBA6645]